MFRKQIALPVFFVGGIAALAWQVLWQLDLALALGISAQGTALTVAVVMAGMTLGALWAGSRFDTNPPENPWLTYGLLEIAMGIFAWLPTLLLPLIESLDAYTYQSAPLLATPFFALVLALTLGPSSFAMGATLPVIGIIAEKSARSLSRFYAANTAGAAFGALLVAFVLIPNLGRTKSGFILLTLQLLILGSTWMLSRTKMKSAGDLKTGSISAEEPPPSTGSKQALTFAALTGFAVFALEVSWFRLLRAAWLSTTDSFAVMLFVFLAALAIGAWISKPIRKWGISLSVVLGIAGMGILLATPIIERFDQWGTAGGSYSGRITLRVLAAFFVMGLPVALMGVSLPCLLDEVEKPRDWARLYGINTIGAVFGSLAAGWVFMSLLGPVKSSWLIAGLLIFTSIRSIQKWRGKFEMLLPAVFFFVIAWMGNSHIGVERIQGPTAMVRRDHQLLAHINGPDVTTSVVRTPQGMTALFIDGYAATGEFGAGSRYMDAMGRLPMLLHSDPKDALVICFGTGRTARAVLDENPQRLTIVDVNPAVFDLAGFFVSNRDVLKDQRVRVRTMDGRAWLRRSDTDYDVITLEPMPPFFAGTNSLYSVEFYELIHQRLKDDGFAAQWFPMHLMTPEHARAVAAAFVKIFPAATLWIDPDNRDATGSPQQGILIGRKGNREWDRWPGFDRPSSGPRPLSFAEVNNSLFLDSEALARYTATTMPVTDDNQILSYGKDALHRQDLSKHLFSSENMEELERSKAPRSGTP